MFPLRWNFPFRKKDGSISTIDAVISEGGGGGYTLPTASAETKGGIKIGSGLAMEGEVLNNSNPTAYTLPTASAETKGGVKIGSGLSIDENGILKDESTIVTQLTGLINVDSDADITISHDGDIYTIAGEVTLTNELNVGSKIQIGQASIPESARVLSAFCPMVVTICDQQSVTLGMPYFESAILAVYANGDIFIENTLKAENKAKYVFICCQYRKMEY